MSKIKEAEIIVNLFGEEVVLSEVPPDSKLYSYLFKR